MAMVIFEESSTFNPADYGLQIGDVLNIVCVGGGGSGGGGYKPEEDFVTAGGAGAGGDVRFASFVLSSLLGIAVTVGEGGASAAAGNDGVAGGSSSFGSVLSSLGGPAGKKGDGGSSAYWVSIYADVTNETNMSVGRSFAKINNTDFGPGGGGGYLLGGTIFGGVGADETGASSATGLGGASGANGLGYGAGGHGGKAATASGAGCPGVVIVTW